MSSPSVVALCFCVCLVAAALPLAQRCVDAQTPPDLASLLLSDGNTLSFDNLLQLSRAETLPDSLGAEQTLVEVAPSPPLVTDAAGATMAVAVAGSEGVSPTAQRNTLIAAAAAQQVPAPRQFIRVTMNSGLRR